MNLIPFAPFEPDKALLGVLSENGHAPEARGIIPCASGYKPLPSPQLEPGLAALPGDFMGGVALYDTERNSLVVAGTKTNLYLLKSGAWTSLRSGRTMTSGQWDFARYGNTLIAVNGADVPQYATIGIGSVSTFKDVPGAPVASSVEVVGEFVMLGGVDVTKIRWSAIGNPLSWPAPGSNAAQYTQADEQDFPDTGSTVAVSGALTGTDVIVFTERAVHRGQYVGSPYVFQFDILDKRRGALAPASVVTADNGVFYLAEDGFYVTDGASVRNISAERVTEWFRSVSDDTLRYQTRGGRDPVSGFICWTFAGKTAATGVHDMMLLYHPLLDRWSYATVTTNGIFEGLSQSTTLEALDAIGPLDKLPFSLDSRVWMGGVPGLCVFSGRNLAWLAGSPMEAALETAEQGGERFMIHGVRPLIDGEAGELATVSVLCRDFQHRAPVETVCAPVSTFDGLAHTHVSTRYARARIVLPEGADWSFAMGCEVLSEPEGTA